MATRERPAERGRRRGAAVVHRLLHEIRNARISGDISTRAMAQALGWSTSAYRRFEAGAVATTLIDVGAAAALVGLELSASLFPAGQQIHDRGHQALIQRIRAILSQSVAVFAEAPFPGTNDLRSWDLFLRIDAQRVGIEAETRIRDIQQLVRHMRERVRDGGAHVVVLFLADTRSNRAMIDELRVALGPEFAGKPSLILEALRAGRPLAGGGVVLI